MARNKVTFLVLGSFCGMENKNIHIIKKKKVPRFPSGIAE